MKPEKESIDNRKGELEFKNSSSLDDFIKELEDREKDLHISSDLIVEIEESDIAEADGLALLNFLDGCQETNSRGNSTTKSIDTDYPPSNQNVSKLETEVEKLRGQISKFESERSETNELSRRRQSDFDNYRKRIERERSEMMRNLLSSVATEILPVIDNLSRALDSAAALPGKKSDDFQQFVDGIGLVNQQLEEVLGEMGIQPIFSVGERFDPNFHEAVAAESTDAYPPHTVIAELLRGYRIDNKIIRHSLVKVSAPAAESTLTNSRKS